MKIASASFVRSVTSPAGLPADGVPQIALVGRSNVGKSSLINALTGQRLARTSAAPGKTRLLNLYEVIVRQARSDALYLVDLPGYGYARGGAASTRAFDRLARDYFGTGEARGAPSGPAGVLLVVDARHPGLPQDVRAAGWTAQRGLPAIAVASKIDKLSRRERIAALDEARAALGTDVVGVSSATGEGVAELWRRILGLVRGPGAIM